MKFEPVIGLEVHVQLKTASKLFCSCSTEFGREPNRNTCPVCLGLPGVLPVANRVAVQLALRAALSLSCKIAPMFKFDRKNYFYPDLPKAYQVSQYDIPIASDGFLVVAGRRIGILRVHMEEDAGKLVHAEPGHGVPPGTSFVDYNRTGVPLAEIVTLPDIRNPEEAHAYLDSLKHILRYAGVSDCDMEKGSLRCDANVSVRPEGETRLGVKTELKNLNSFKFVEKALQVEIVRQIDVLQGGGAIIQETRGYDSERNITFSQRSKEEAHDYRYFPEPDLPAFTLTPADIDKVRAELPELPEARRARFESSYGLPAYDAEILTTDIAMADYFETVIRAGADPKKASNFIMTELLRDLKSAELSADRSPVTPEHLAELLKLAADGKISGTIAKDVFAEMFKTGKAPADIMREQKVELIADAGALSGPIDEVLAANAKAVDDIKAGKQNAMGFLVGQVMKKTRGQADPKMVTEIIQKKLQNLS